MLIISNNVKLSEKDIELLRSKGEIVITPVITAYGTDDISIAVEQEENNKEAYIKRCNCDKKREILQNKIEQLNELDFEINQLTRELDSCDCCN
ncbi:hypothetical protein FDB40_17405 [Clostridium botulinum]|nr:hypothetical protein [Clostridium botulinum]